MTQAKPAERGGSFTPLDETLGIITPSALHYVVQRGGRPDIDPRSTVSSSPAWSIAR